MTAKELFKPPAAESTIEIAELESLPIRELTRGIKTLFEAAPKQICFERAKLGWITNFLVSLPYQSVCIRAGFFIF